MSAWFQTKTESFTDRCTVVVVGAGAGGAIAALTLAEAGIDVVIVEEGFHQPPETSPYAISPAIDAMYAEGGFRTMEGQPPIPVVGGRGLGGSTLINSAISFRTPERTVDEWNSLSGGAFDDTDEYYRAQDDVEAIIRVGPTPDRLLSGYDKAHKVGAAKLGWREHNLRRNTPGCVGCCRCCRRWFWGRTSRRTGERSTSSSSPSSCTSAT